MSVETARCTVLNIHCRSTRSHKGRRAGTSWGEVVGLDIVADEEVEEELAQTEEDREVKNLLRSNKQKVDRLQKGTVH